MYDSGKRCPNCWATTLIRTKQTGPYMPGECVNCRLDRSEELPNAEAKPVQDFVLPDGVKHLSGNWYELPSGEKVNGKRALAAALGGET